MNELRDMQRLVQELWRIAPPAEFHVGDLAWWSREPERRTRMWRGNEGTSAWAGLSSPGELEYLVHPGHPDVHDDVLVWFEEEADARELTVWALEDDHLKTEALERHGYAPADGAFFIQLTRGLNDVPSPQLAEGYRLAHVRGPADIPRRVAVQRAAFTSTMTDEKYARLLATWPYRANLDVVVEAADGGYAAFCLAWLDDDNGVAELEPVGTHPDHTRKGLASAAICEALRRAAAAGAATAIVYARGDDIYPAPLRLYRTLGFEPARRRVRYVTNR